MEKYAENPNFPISYFPTLKSKKVFAEIKSNTLKSVDVIRCIYATRTYHLHCRTDLLAFLMPLDYMFVCVVCVGCRCACAHVRVYMGLLVVVLIERTVSFHIDSLSLSIDRRIYEEIVARTYINSDLGHKYIYIMVSISIDVSNVRFYVCVRFTCYF